MLREVIKIFYAIRKFLGIVQYDSTTGLNVAGTVVPYESVTYSQFMDAGFDVATARYVLVSDLYSTTDSGITAPSRWRIDPAAGTTRKRVLDSGPVYSATLDVALDPTDHPGVKCYIADIKADVVSNGSVYEPVGPYVVLKNITTEVTKSSSLTSEWFPLPVEIPRDVNGNSLLRTGGYLQIHSIWWGKTGTADNMVGIVRLGPTSTGGSDTAIITTSGSNNQTRWGRDIELKRTGTDTVMFRGDGSTFFTNGPGSATHASNSTIHNFDANDTYVNVGSYLSAVTTDSALQIKEYELRLFKASA